MDEEQLALVKRVRYQMVPTGLVLGGEIWDRLVAPAL
jgi:hypothetical protein